MTRWTPDMDRALRDGIASGRLYAEIAPELGVTRNACIGRANRIGVRAGNRGDRISKAVAGKPRFGGRRFDHDDAVWLRCLGVSVADIAEGFGVSKPAIYRALRVAA